MEIRNSSPVIPPPVSPIPYLLLLLAGFAIRLYGLGGQSLWYDETVSAYLARQPVAELVAHTARDIHPPGYYLLLRGWSLLAGDSEFSLAFFSLIFGLLTIALTARLAARLLGRRGAWLAALLVAVSPYHLWYSQEVRMYTLASALGLAAALFGLRAIQTGKRRHWAGYALAAAAGMYALYYFAFLLVALNLCFLGLVWQRRAKRGLVDLLAANFGAALMYLPWMPIALRQAVNPPVPPWRDPAAVSLWPILRQTWTALSLGQSVEPEGAGLWQAGFAILFLLGLAVIARSPRRGRLTGPARAALLVAYTFGPLALIYLLSFITPLYHVRYMFTYSPAFYVVLAAGLAGLTRRRRLWAALALALVLGGSAYSIGRYHTNPLYAADDFRAAVRLMETRWRPGDVLMTNAGYTYTAFDYYAARPYLRRRLTPYQPPDRFDRPILLMTGSVDGDPQLGWGDPQSDFFAMSRAEAEAALSAMGRDYGRLWMLRAYDTVVDPDGFIRAWLSDHAVMIEDQLLTGPSNIRVQGFLLQGAPLPAGQTAVPFADGLLLAGWRVPAQVWRPGDVVPVQLWWQTTSRPSTDYKMSLKLWRGDGQLAAQGQDEWPVGSLYRPTDWPLGQPVYHPVQITLPPDLPAGQYWLNVELYHPDTIQPLPRLDSPEKSVSLGGIQVSGE